MRFTFHILILRKIFLRRRQLRQIRTRNILLYFQIRIH
jgi:hypothetical protein